jgi:hypothetical protein
MTRRQGPRPGLEEGEQAHRRSGRAMAPTGYFPAAAIAGEDRHWQRRRSSANKIAGLCHPPLSLRPCALLPVPSRSARGLSSPSRPRGWRSIRWEQNRTAPHILIDRACHGSPSALWLATLCRRSRFSADAGRLRAGRFSHRHLRCPRPTLADTALDPDLDELLWSTVNMFHRAGGRLERPRAPNSSPPNGPTLGRFRRSASLQTGRNTAKRLRSSATTPCSTSCRSASSSFRAPVYRTIWRTRPKARHQASRLPQARWRVDVTLSIKTNDGQSSLSVSKRWPRALQEAFEVRTSRSWRNPPSSS